MEKYLTRKFVIVFSLLVLGLFVVSACSPGETLAGKATGPEVKSCKKNRDCFTEYTLCVSNKACSTVYTGNLAKCKGLKGSENKNCLATAVQNLKSCTNTCWDASISKAFAPKCIDSDAVGGSDGHDAAAYKVYGEVTDEKGEKHYDGCNEDGTLTEQLCAPNWEPETYLDCALNVPGTVCENGACVKLAVAPPEPACPVPDTICTEKFELMTSKSLGWFAFTRVYDSECQTKGWTAFTAGNVSCGAKADSCVAGKGCVAVETTSTAWQNTDN